MTNWVKHSGLRPRIRGAAFLSAPRAFRDTGSDLRYGFRRFLYTPMLPRHDGPEGYRFDLAGSRCQRQ